MPKLIYLTQNRTLAELPLLASGGGFTAKLPEAGFCLYVSSDNGIVTDIKGFTDKEQACFKSPQLLQIAPPTDSDYRKQYSDVTFFFDLRPKRFSHNLNVDLGNVVTGTLSPVFVYTCKIPAYTIKEGIIRLFTKVRKNNAGTATATYSLSLVGTLPAVGSLGTALGNSTILSFLLIRDLIIKDGLLYSYADTGGNPVTSTIAADFLPFDYTKDYYISVYLTNTQTDTQSRLAGFCCDIIKNS